MTIDKNMKILVVDDFSMMRKVIKNILKQLDFHVILEAENGREALELLKSNEDIALVITDWHMPVMNGLELLIAIRKNPPTAKLPVLMVTAEALQENILAAIKAGVSNFVVKPFDANMMKEKIDKIFKPETSA